MADYIAIAGVIAAAAGTAVTVQSSQAQAKTARNYALAQQNEAAEAARLEVQQYEEERKAEALRAEQEQAAIMRETQRAVSAQNAIRAARGLDTLSATGRALLDENLEEGRADLETSLSNAGRVDARIRLGETASVARSRVAAESAARSAQNTAIQARGQTYGALASGTGSIARTSYSYLSKARA